MKCQRTFEIVSNHKEIKILNNVLMYLIIVLNSQSFCSDRVTVSCTFIPTAINYQVIEFQTPMLRQYDKLLNADGSYDSPSSGFFDAVRAFHGKRQITVPFGFVNSLWSEQCNGDMRCVGKHVTKPDEEMHGAYLLGVYAYVGRSTIEYVPLNSLNEDTQEVPTEHGNFTCRVFDDW